MIVWIIMTDVDYICVNFSDANKILKKYIGYDISILKKIDRVKKFQQICRIDDYSSKSDIELLDKLNIKKYLIGNVFIYTEDYSIDNNIIFEIQSSKVEFFVRQFHENFNTPFFKDKTIFICPNTQKLLLYFAEGWWFYYDLPLEFSE